MSRKKIGTLRDCVCRTDSGGGGIAGVGDVTIRIDTPTAGGAPSIIPNTQVRKPRKPRSKGKGDFCVLSHKGKVVHCYESESTAQRVADSFSRRGKSGTKFTVSNRNER